MIRLPEGVTVHVGGQKYRGEIPAAVCPKELNPPGRETAVEKSNVPAPRTR